MSNREAVNQLYDFRDHYFEHHSPEEAKKKIEDLSAELEKTLNLFSSVDDSDVNNKTECELLKAKALNVLPDYNPEVMEILTKLVKFHPKLVEAWNELGTCFWKKGDLKAAKSCFESATREGGNSESLRNLSMILRQIEDSPEDKLANIHLSLEKAKEAVNLNLQDGKSWYILGNAYLSLYFTTDQNPSHLKQCLSSYSRAFSDESLKCNPDLHYNWSMALKYDENYRLALENFEKAMKYDPLWNEPKEQLDSLIKHLDNMQNLIEKKGKLKSRKIKKLLSALKKENEKLSTTFKDSSGKTSTFQLSKFSDLQVGLNSGKFLHGKVVCHVYCSDAPSFTFGMIDEGENCFAVNVYNMAQGKGVIIGDSVIIIHPFIQHFDFNYKEKFYKFSTIRVNSPLQLEVNGKKLGLEVQAPPRLSVTVKSD